MTTILLAELLPVESTVDPAAGGGDSTVPDPGADVAAASRLGLLGELIEGSRRARDIVDVGAGVADLANDCL